MGLSTAATTLRQIKQLSEDVPATEREFVHLTLRKTLQPTRRSISSYVSILHEKLNAGARSNEHISQTDIIRLLMALGLNLNFQQIIDNGMISS